MVLQPSLATSYKNVVIQPCYLLMKSLQVSDIGLGRNIYANKQLDEFAVFQDSQSTRKAYLARPLSWPQRKK
jgi:hypothetical protein